MNKKVKRVENSNRSVGTGPDRKLYWNNGHRKFPGNHWKTKIQGIEDFDTGAQPQSTTAVALALIEFSTQPNCCRHSMVMVRDRLVNRTIPWMTYCSIPHLVITVLPRLKQDIITPGGIKQGGWYTTLPGDKGQHRGAPN